MKRKSYVISFKGVMSLYRNNASSSNCRFIAIDDVEYQNYDFWTKEK